MTIEQANQYFAALPDGFASTEQLRAAFTAPAVSYTHLTLPTILLV